jgi:hypothetical protein
MEPIPVMSELPAVGPLAYADTARDDATAPATLRRLSLLNLVCGALILAQFPALFTWLLILPRLAGAHHWAVPPTVSGMLRTSAGQWRNALLPVAFAVLCGAAAITSGWLVSRRRGRVFSVVAGFVMCCSLPFGIVAGLPTAIILMRRATGVAYAADRARSTGQP